MTPIAALRRFIAALRTHARRPSDMHRLRVVEAMTVLLGAAVGELSPQERATLNKDQVIAQGPAIVNPRLRRSHIARAIYSLAGRGWPEYNAAAYFFAGAAWARGWGFHEHCDLRRQEVVAALGTHVVLQTIAPEHHAAIHRRRGKH